MAITGLETHKHSFGRLVEDGSLEFHLHDEWKREFMEDFIRIISF
jgi:hypothetical protein